MMLKTLASLLALTQKIEEAEDHSHGYQPHGHKALDLPEYHDDEDGGKWVPTGKTAKHSETGKTTYEYAKYDKDGNKTGQRHYKDAEGNFMGESVKLKEETAFARAMKKAIDAEERGDTKRLQYHLKNAKMARYGLKSTEMSKLKDLLDKYMELRDKHAPLEEAKGKLMYEPKHTLWAVIPKSKKEFVKTFAMNKHADAEQYAHETAGKLVKIDQAGRVIKEQKASEEALHLMEPIGQVRRAINGLHDFKAIMSATHGVAQRKVGKDGKVYYVVRGKLAGRYDPLEGAGVIYSKSKTEVSEDYRYLGAAAAYEAEEFKVGDKVKVKMGGMWHDAEVTDGPHKMSGHIEAKFKYGKKTFKTRFDPKMEVKKISEEVQESQHDMVSFYLETERAYEHVMDKFGHVIDWNEDTGMMVMPRKYWGAMQEIALAADGIGATEEDYIEKNPEHYK